MGRYRLSKNFVEKETKRISESSNYWLLSECLFLAQGDDYDGCLTREGEVSFKLMKEELAKRLGDIGFLTKEEAIAIL